jgi:predicted amidohydrolase YtcJ
MPADLVVLDAKVHTMDPEQATATAVAIQGNLIAAVGDNESMKAWIGDKTQVIRARGQVLVPGFNDSHVHFLQGGQQLSSVQLRDAATPAEFKSRMDSFAKTLSAGRWIVGGDWDHENWPEGNLPHRDWIDSFTLDRGVFITRLDGHMGLANSYALELAGIDEKTPDPPGGTIVREPETGKPTGVLKDAAMNLVTKHIPALSWDAKRSAAIAATEHAASLGITSVQDMSGEEYVPVFESLRKEGKLKTRIYAVAPLPQWKRSAEQNLKAAIGSDWIRRGGLKGFADGSLGSTTALFFEPYLDEPRTSGLPADEMFPEGAMLERVRGADAAGLQIMIHAIGDAANAKILEIYEKVTAENPSRDRRFRIEHSQHLRLADIPRFRTAKVIASMQPFHCADDGRWAWKRIGNDRAKGTYAFRSLLDAGVVLAFGSDWNVATLNPIAGIEAAVTRRTLDGKHPDGWIPEQKITVEEAVRAYTVGSAYAEYAETKKGMIKSGMLADMVLVSDDIFESGFDRWKGTQVSLTIVDGQIVFER